MVSIILACSDETKQKAIAAGFIERPVLIRREDGYSTPENKSTIEIKIRKDLMPFQYLVSDFWGMGPD